MVENLDESITQMEQSLLKLSEDYHKTRGGGNNSAIGSVAGGGDVSVDGNPVVKIVNILNSHHESLNWLDEQARYALLLLLCIYKCLSMKK